MNISSQDLNALWKQYEEAVSKDLPRDQIKTLDSIIELAAKKQQYGHLLKARLLHVDAVTSITPDSLESEVKVLVEEEKKTAANQPALAAVYQSVLGKVYTENSSLGENSQDIAKDYFAKSLSNPSLLASKKAADFDPLFEKGDDSKYFNNDLLSVLAMQTGDFALLRDVYAKQGNREAACIADAFGLRQQFDTFGTNKQLLPKVDSLLNVYGDLDVAGELALLKYDILGSADNATAAEQVAYIDQMTERYKAWPRIVSLSNSRASLMQKQFSFNTNFKVMLPQREHQVNFTFIRNISSLTLTLWRLNISADENVSLYNKKQVDKVREKIVKGTEQSVRHAYSGHQPYDVFTDSVMLPALQPGVYLMNVRADDASVLSEVTGDDVKQDWSVFYVSDVYMLSEGLPNDNMRLAVVSATTGKPLPYAMVRLHSNYRNEKDTLLKCDAKGEVITNQKSMRSRTAKAYTKTDDFCPSQGMWSQSYYYNQVRHERFNVSIFTDRAIYRPGQPVHFALISLVNYDGKQAKALAGEKIKVVLRDANRQTVEEKEVVTDEFGKASGVFILPAKGLTGQFLLYTSKGNKSIRVEEYKRPTFEVEIDEVEEVYKNGDTISVTGRAKTYSGVPVQGARVAYTVVRRQPSWWYWDAGDEEMLLQTEATTDDKGEFKMTVPVVMPENERHNDMPWRARCYNIVAEAVVTDQGGESHTASISLPLGDKATSLSFHLPERSEVGEFTDLRFTLLNIAGQEVDGEVTYYIDNKPQAYTAKANTKVELPVKAEKLGTGKHTFKAICQGDTVTQDIVLFTIGDKRPPVETHDWFYATSSRFPADGKPVYVQVGSSDPDTYVFYNVFSGDKVLESGTFTLNNANNTKAWKYKEEYGNGILLTFAWVRDGKLYSHQHSIAKPVVDKSIHLSWETFRDRLTPGQDEEWTLKATYADGTPADAQLVATLYDKSLDQFASHYLSFSNLMFSPLPSTSWRDYWPGGFSGSGMAPIHTMSIPGLEFTHFDEGLFRFYSPRFFDYTIGGSGGVRLHRTLSRNSAQVDMLESAPMAMAMEEASAGDMEMRKEAPAPAPPKSQLSDTDSEEASKSSEPEMGQVRENLEETAFFMPAIVTDSQGILSLKFRLPESVTTWRFLGLVTDREANSGNISGESVAQKEVMVVPNVPRFVRVGDKAQVSARVINTSDHKVEGKARMLLIDPEDESVCYEQEVKVNIPANQTQAVTFQFQPEAGKALLVCRVMASGEGFSDGEQHYLPVLPDREQVTVTLPITQHGPQTTRIDLAQLFPKGTTDGKLTIEYTNNPAWLMVQALPSLAEITSENAISLAANYYANAIGQYIMNLSPNIEQTIGKWKAETSKVGSLTSHLAKNEELKDLLLNETPWVSSADKEESQMQRLSDYFDKTLIESRLSKAFGKLEGLQLSDGSWSWWEGMKGSPYITAEVCEMLSRLDVLIGKQKATQRMQDRAFSFLDKALVKEAEEMRKDEKKGRSVRPSENALQILYINAIASRKMEDKAQEAAKYMVDIAARKTHEYTIFGKARAAVILSAFGKQQKAAEYIESIRQYSVLTKEMGRYFDTRKAYYSWRSYNIPTEVAAMEAFRRLEPQNVNIIDEMRIWLLQQKRAQLWDTTVNSVDAIYAFLNGNMTTLDQREMARLAIDDTPIDTQQATAGLGYVKTAVAAQDKKEFVVSKNTEGTSWGAVYAQFLQPTSEIANVSSSISVKREYFCDSSSPKVGDVIRVRITIKAERDLDFVEVIDRRAACMEPVRQLSGYHFGYYIAPKDYTTTYYFDKMPKGTHVVEAEYYLDRAGTYSTGSCKAQCAYAPEYAATEKAHTVVVNP